MLKRFLAALAFLCATTVFAADVNKASEADLDGIKGIGPATTRLIMEQRKSAPFADWADVSKRVKGIGAKRAAKLSGEGLTVNGQPFAGAAEASAKPGKPTPPAPAPATADAGKAQKP